MPEKRTPRPRARQAGKPKHKAMVTAKQALAEAITQLGPDASSDELGQFMRNRFGIRTRFVLVVPQRKSRVSTPRPGKAA